MENTFNCVLCNDSANLICTFCGLMTYCSQQHMENGRKAHKLSCKPYFVAHSTKLGRHLVASKDIRKGDVILKEMPLVFGPGDNRYVSMVCYSCGGVANQKCQDCSVALMCSNTCPGSFHSKFECNTFKIMSKQLGNKGFISADKIVLPLRCVIHAKQPKDAEWNKFLSLQSHKEERRDTIIWHQNNYIIKLLQTLGVITKSYQDTEMVQEVLGIIDVNSFGVRCGLDCQGRALYMEASLMAHDCCPNCHLAVDDDLQMTVRARQDIPKGYPILYNYTNSLHGTAQRQEHLLETKYFSCSCQRCEDPSELGSHLSSLTCWHCRMGLMVSNGTSDLWVCQQCNRTFGKAGVEVIIHSIIPEHLVNLDMEEPHSLETTLKKLSKILGPNHSVIMDLKQQLATKLRECKQSVQVLERRKTLVKDILIVLGFIEPGISRLRGLTLYELHSILLNLAEHEPNSLQDLKECESILREAIGLLLYEPVRSPEGRCAQQGLAQLKLLTNRIIQMEGKQKKELRKQ